NLKQKDQNVITSSQRTAEISFKCHLKDHTIHFACSSLMYSVFIYCLSSIKSVE
ncbi:hypothetical protein LDENG_00241740, partial [Lucifuga dentata]